ncbi:uncharacterized protein MONBRDRAFT_22624 [Monosiga brevicollis MX1]|uniref:Polycomb protein VEFS-Box domain-containing protein n=1 Tax=Monosiga brevicollis TaxID=81824 RepID=A9UNK3_MONBE|nr:uncharacterized protein MONBRDRAFT_22624 [Monosiga brevicollis MX1]EDQ92710.1 predicted protein [Monosiga brevicollis MX1]|eukprot:XP_001742472.1 hypothetical protein [Monosiga brevicollis MX1]
MQALQAQQYQRAVRSAERRGEPEPPKPPPRFYPRDGGHCPLRPLTRAHWFLEELSCHKIKRRHLPACEERPKSSVTATELIPCLCDWEPTARRFMTGQTPRIERVSGVPPDPPQRHTDACVCELIPLIKHNVIKDEGITTRPVLSRLRFAHQIRAQRLLQGRNRYRRALQAAQALNAAKSHARIKPPCPTRLEVHPPWPLFQSPLKLNRTGNVHCYAGAGKVSMDRAHTCEIQADGLESPDTDTSLTLTTATRQRRLPAPLRLIAQVEALTARADLTFGADHSFFWRSSRPLFINFAREDDHMLVQPDSEHDDIKMMEAFPTPAPYSHITCMNKPFFTARAGLLQSSHMATNDFELEMPQALLREAHMGREELGQIQDMAQGERLIAGLWNDFVERQNARGDLDVGPMLVRFLAQHNDLFCQAGLRVAAKLHTALVVRAVPGILDQCQPDLTAALAQLS